MMHNIYLHSDTIWVSAMTNILYDLHIRNHSYVNRDKEKIASSDVTPGH